jgi:hypothetical protein
MTHKVQDLNRRNLSFSRSKVKEVLPEYFADAYPNLVTFLEKYYEYLEDENANSFKTEINNLFIARDPEQVDEDKLDYILQEVGNGLKSASFFDNPRLMTSLLSRFYRVKGSLNSIEGFFRGFFGQEVTIEYPKNQMFIVGNSEIGYDSQKFIQNNKLYQIFSILIKSAIATAEYNDLYLKFVHPAGFYFAGQVELEGTRSFGLEGLFGADSVLPEDVAAVIYSDVGTFGMTSLATELTALYDSDANSTNDYRISISEYVEKYKYLTIDQMNKFYTRNEEILTPNSFTFDDSGTGTGWAVNVNKLRYAIQLLSLNSSYFVNMFGKRRPDADSDINNILDINGTNTVTVADVNPYVNAVRAYNDGDSDTYTSYVYNVLHPTILANPDSYNTYSSASYTFAGYEYPYDQVTINYNTGVLDSIHTSGPDMSMTLETMDNGMYTVYLDSGGDSYL